MFLQYLNRFWMHWGQKEDDFDGTSLARVWHEFGTKLLLGIVLRSQLQFSVECTKMSLKVAQGCQNVAKWKTLVYLGVAKGCQMHKKWKWCQLISCIVSNDFYIGWLIGGLCV